MIQPGLQRRHFAWFSGAAMVVYGMAALVGAGLLASDGAAGLSGSRGPSHGLAYGVSADLVLTLPVLFWWLLLRGPRRTAWWSSAGAAWSVVAVAAAGWLAAGWLLPATQAPAVVAAPLAQVFAAVALGAAAVYLLGWMTETDGVIDPVDRVSSRLGGAFGQGIVAKALTAALAPGATVFGLAFSSWRHAPAAPAGAKAFGQHRRSLHGEMLLGLLVASVAEVLAVHFLAARWSVGVAWVLTVLSLYGSIWLIADYRAAVLRPVLLKDDAVQIRAGLRFQLDVPLASVDRIDSKRPDVPSMALTILSEPEQWLVFSEPVLAKGPYGIRREVRAVGVTVDQPSEFIAEFV